MRKIINIFLITITMILAAGLLIAIGAEDAKPAPQRSPSGISISREEIPHLVEIIRVWKLVDELGLNEEQLMEFLPKFKELNSLRSGYYRSRRETVKKLTKLLEGNTPETQLKSVTEKFRDTEVEYYVKYKQTQDALESNLNVKQRAQFIVFEDKYRDDMRRLIRTLRGLSDQREPRRERQPVPLKENKAE